MTLSPATTSGQTRERERIRRITTPVGDPAWLVPGYNDVKALLSDGRLRRSHPDPDRAPRFSAAATFGGPIGSVSGEAADHARLRTLLTPAFSARRIECFRRNVEALVDQLLDDMELKGSPADFHEAVSFPLPALMIAVLLGIPPEDRHSFRVWSEAASDVTDAARSQAGWSQLHDYVRALLQRKRSALAEDVLSDLVRAQVQAGGAFTDEHVAQLGAGLLFAGHETTVAALDRAMLLMFTNPSQRELLRDAATIRKAVEEILRLPNPVDALDRTTGILRYAATDIAFADRHIAAGELVILSLHQANMDDAVFTRPEQFNIERDEAAHLTFGYGIHYCIGAPLARLELEIVLAAVVKRFPTMVLAAPLGTLQMRQHAVSRGLIALPVKWSATRSS